MQLHISPSLRHVTVLPTKGVKEFIKFRIVSRQLSFRVVFYSLLLFTFLLRFVFLLTAVDTIDGESKCSGIGCFGRKIRPSILGRQLESTLPEVIYSVLEEPANETEIQVGPETPQTLEDLIAEFKGDRPDAKTFAIKLKAMINFLEQTTRTAKIQEYLYRHVASNSIPKQLHCLSLMLANEHSSNANARLQLPSPELVPALVDNSFFHFVLASDNVLAASVVASSLVRNSLHPEKFVLHVITDKKTYSQMQAWFSLHPLTPAIVEVKGLHHFDWFTKGKVPVLEAMEKDQKARSQFRGGSSAIVANQTEKPRVIAAKLQALSPKYNSLMNHIRIHLPELFPSLNKVVFLDDDIVVQTDLSPLWDIDMKGKVNGAVQTCRGEDKSVMFKHFKSYLNFSHPLIAKNLDPNECAWAYGMNIFDLEAWRRTNISQTYHHWLEQDQTLTTTPKVIASREGSTLFTATFSRGGLLDLALQTPPNDPSSHPVLDLALHWPQPNVNHITKFRAENLKSDLSLWQLGTLPPGLIAFHGHVHVIDSFWHMLGLGYQDNTSIAEAARAGVVHFNGRAKPWLDIAFPQLRSLWTKYVNFSDTFIKTCHITAS